MSTLGSDLNPIYLRSGHERTFEILLKSTGREIG